MSILGDLGAGIGSLLGAGEGIMGVSGGVQQVLNDAAPQANLQPYMSALNNTLQPLQPQWAAAQAQPQRPQPIFAMHIAVSKLEEQVRELVRQLPMSIAGNIHSCMYYEKDPDEAARFVIVFNNRRTLTFYDVDAFPSAEHVGRIALECP